MLILCQWRIWCWEDRQHKESHPVLCNNCINGRLEQERATVWQNAGSVHLNHILTMWRLDMKLFITTATVLLLMMWVHRGLWRIKSSRPTLCWRLSGTPRLWGTTTPLDLWVKGVLVLKLKVTIIIITLFFILFSLDNEKFKMFSQELCYIDVRSWLNYDLYYIIEL